jgi:hypothetical protein
MRGSGIGVLGRGAAVLVSGPGYVGRCVTVIGMKRVSVAVFAGSILLCGCAIDKKKHFVAGAAASSWVYLETGDRSLACLTALGAGVAKEVYDARGDGTADAQDIAATMLGCSVTWAWD